MEVSSVASKRHQRRRGCEGKKGFPTHGGALYAMKRMEAQTITDHNLNVYHCGFGRHYHIGHRVTGRGWKN